MADSLHGQLQVNGGIASFTKQQVRDIAIREMQTPFKLAKPPLMRATLLKSCKANDLLLLTPHHIIIDGWSIRLLVHDLAVAYDAICRAQLPLTLPKIERQYLDFSFWQRQQLESGAWQHQLDFWTKELQVVLLPHCPTVHASD